MGPFALSQTRRGGGGRLAACWTSAGSNRCTWRRCAREELHAGREPHVLFQASTIAALLEGAYDGDLSFAELAEHGDLGLGTLDGLDGEMIALDGRFYRADVTGPSPRSPPRRGRRSRWWLGSRRRSTWSSTVRSSTTSCSLGCDRIPAERASCAIRVDGASSCPRSLGPPQTPPYRPLYRGRRRAARLRAHRCGRDDARLSLPRLRRGDRGQRLPPPLHQRGPRPRGGHVLGSRRRRARASASIPPATFTSSCRPASSSPIPALAAAPTPRSSGSSTPAEHRLRRRRRGARRARGRRASRPARHPCG